MYLMYGLDDEHYTQPDIFWSDSLSKAIAIGNEFIYDWLDTAYPDLEITQTENKCSTVGHNGDKFYCADVFNVDKTKGKYVVVWHHAYNGVDFEIRYQSDDKIACGLFVTQQIQEVVSKLEPYYQQQYSYGDMCIDTGNEWEMWNILEIGE